MIGQKKLLSFFDKYTVDTFPRSAMLIGEKGCGKHTLVNYIRDNIIKFPVVDISNNLSAEVIDNIYKNPNPSIYLIDLSLLYEKEQNIILKFLEEPLNNAFIIVLCENKNLVLDTILNRVVCFTFDQYTGEELKHFTQENIDEKILKNILRTPGNIQKINQAQLIDLISLTDKMVEKINIASAENTLSIKNKINFKDEYDKFDLQIFLNSLENSVYNRFLNTNSKTIYEMYKTLVEAKKTLLNLKINKEYWFEHLLMSLWEVSRHGY